MREIESTTDSSMSRYRLAVLALCIIQLVILAATLPWPTFIGAAVPLTILLALVWLIVIVFALRKHGGAALFLLLTAPFIGPLIGFYFILALIVCGFGGC